MALYNQEGKRVEIERKIKTKDIPHRDQLREVNEFPAPHCKVDGVRIFSIEQRVKLKGV